MTLYEIKYGLENEITGNTPQTVFVTGNNPDLRRVRIHEVHSKGIEIPKMKVNEGSNLTDLINTFSLMPGNGFVISQGMFDTIMNMRIPICEFAKLSIIDKGKEIGYYWFYIPIIDATELISFKSSTFRRIPGKASVKLKSENQYLKELEKNRASYIEWTELLLYKDIFEDFDIINFGFGSINWFISDKHKHLFDEFTGIELKECRNVKVQPRKKKWLF